MSEAGVRRRPDGGGAAGQGAACGRHRQADLRGGGPAAMLRGHGGSKDVLHHRGPQAGGVAVDGKELSTGLGKSKKLAEQAAAKAALEQLGN